MEQKSRQLPLLRVAQTDYIAFLALGFPGVIWVIYIAVAYFGFFPDLRGREPLTGAAAPFFLRLGIITTLVGVPLFIWRVRSFQALFAQGAQVAGRITSISFFRDRGRIEYTYTWEGKTYKGYNAVMKTKRTQALEPGTEVILIVDKNHPQRALIRDLYT